MLLIAAFFAFAVLPWLYIWACVKWARAMVSADPDIRRREAALAEHRSQHPES